MTFEPPSSADVRIKLLSISGGGYLGLYSALVLEYLESAGAYNEDAQIHLADQFKVIGGTSIGGILALGLAFKVPAARMVTLLKTVGPSIFPNSESRWKWFRSLVGPLYKPSAIAEELGNLVGYNMRLGDAKLPVVVPALNLKDNRVDIFLGGLHGKHAELRVVDVAIATSAAPFYFPAAQISTALYADGGLVANSPDLLLLQRAFELGFTDTRRLHLLSVGTTISPSAFSADSHNSIGVWGWLRGDLRLLRHVMKGQADLAEQLTRTILVDASNRIKIDREQTSDQARHLGLDRATPKATELIQSLYESTLRDPQSKLTYVKKHWMT